MQFDHLLHKDGIIKEEYRSNLCEYANQILSTQRSISTQDEPVEDDEAVARGLEDELGPLLGQGQARFVFSLPSSWVIDSKGNFVVKLPRPQLSGSGNEQTDGLMQNATEVETSDDLFIENKYNETVKHVFCPVVDYDKTSTPPRWVVMPQGEPISDISTGWEMKETLWKQLLENGVTTDLSVSSTIKFTNDDYRFVDLGMGISEAQCGPEEMRWTHI